ncbi:hypothetical protein V5F72_16200 [Xanthobacter flavus]|uniref:hypothetical protein n=1 Tax=Xanthobacter flavus TaxID=281 RepID=UPI00372C09D1
MAQILSPGQVTVLRCDGGKVDRAVPPSFSKTYLIDETGLVTSFDGVKNAFVAAGHCSIESNIIRCEEADPAARRSLHFTISRPDGVFHRQVDIRDVHLESDGVCRRLI